MTAHWISTCGCLAPIFSPFLMAPWKFACLTCTFWWVHFGKHPHSCWSNLIFLVSTSNLGKFPTKTGRNQISLMSFVGEIHFFLVIWVGLNGPTTMEIVLRWFFGSQVLCVATKRRSWACRRSILRCRAVPSGQGFMGLNLTGAECGV